MKLSDLPITERILLSLRRAKKSVDFLDAGWRPSELNTLIRKFKDAAEGKGLVLSKREVAMLDDLLDEYLLDPRPVTPREEACIPRIARQQVFLAYRDWRREVLGVAKRDEDN